MADISATATSSNSKALPMFDFGERVVSRLKVRNDGTYPGKDVGEVLVNKGDVGYVTLVGTFSSSSTSMRSNSSPAATGRHARPRNRLLDKLLIPCRRSARREGGAARPYQGVRPCSNRANRNTSNSG